MVGEGLGQGHLMWEKAGWRDVSRHTHCPLSGESSAAPSLSGCVGQFDSQAFWQSRAEPAAFSLADLLGARREGRQAARPGRQGSRPAFVLCMLCFLSLNPLVGRRVILEVSEGLDIFLSCLLDALPVTQPLTLA